MDESIDFSFSYLALKMLGRNLYSNAWSALSELVANGLDAKAENVKVIIDTRDYKHSTIEVYDDGNGMTLDNFKANYAKIGYNRRAVQENSDTVMGRKGIGKLAALFLSRKYSIITKTADSDTKVAYQVEFPKSVENKDDENPSLKPVMDIDLIGVEYNDYRQGTMVHMDDVDLTGYKKEALKALSRTFADYFNSSELSKQSIYLRIISNNDNGKFTKISKSVSFLNMTDIICFDKQTEQTIANRVKGKEVKIRISGTKDYLSQPINVHLENRPSAKFDYPNGQGQLTALVSGWIGIYASIRKSEAEKNDTEFVKNKFYSPNRIRIYVRNKLAIADLKNIVGSTQTYANYVEGELTCDFLDDNNFPDIATTSRQDMDENDPRMIFLQQSGKDIMTKIIGYRNRVNEKIKKASKARTKKIDSRAKTIFIEDTNKYIDKHADLDKKKLVANMAKKLNGQHIKKKYSVFISHRNLDKTFIDCIYNILISRGVKKDEIFYSSRDDLSQIRKGERLSQTIRDNLVDNNVLVVFYFTQNFLKGQFTLFEGGAVWATKTDEEFISLCDDNANIPEYLRPDDSFKDVLNYDSDIRRSASAYSNLIDPLNVIITHLNKGRNINDEETIALFKDPGSFPISSTTDAESPADADILKEWDFMQKKHHDEIKKDKEDE